MIRIRRLLDYNNIFIMYMRFGCINNDLNFEQMNLFHFNFENNTIIRWKLHKFGPNVLKCSQWVIYKISWWKALANISNQIDKQKKRKIFLLDHGFIVMARALSHEHANYSNCIIKNSFSLFTFVFLIYMSIQIVHI